VLFILTLIIHTYTMSKNLGFAQILIKNIPVIFFQSKKSKIGNLQKSIIEPKEELKKYLEILKKTGALFLECKVNFKAKTLAQKNEEGLNHFLKNFENQKNSKIESRALVKVIFERLEALAEFGLIGDHQLKKIDEKIENILMRYDGKVRVKFLRNFFDRLKRIN